MFASNRSSPQMELQNDTAIFTPFVSQLSNREYIKNYEVNQPEKYEKFYSSDNVTTLCKSVKVCENFEFTEPVACLVSLCEASSRKSEINAAKYVDNKKLSKLGRIKIPKVAGLFEGVTIACLEVSDIESVSLVSAISVPKDAEEEKYTPYYPCDRLRVNHYIPLKIIKNPQSNFISFFDNPIFLCCEMFTNLSIQVIMKVDYFENANCGVCRCVKMHYLFLNTEVQRKFIESYPLNVM